MTDLAERRVLVTGASSGIGAATARALASAGARVAVTARRREPLDDLAAGTGAIALTADIRDEVAARTMVAAAAERLGGLDALVNNAGVMRPSPVGEGRVHDWRAMLDTNVLAPLIVTHAALPHLRASTCPDVVNVSSQSGRRVPNAAAGVYSASKFAVHALSEGLRQELGGEGIRVTIVSPGLVDTDLAGRNDHPAAVRLRENATAIGLAPADVASEIVHVLSLPRTAHVREVVLAPTAQTT